MTNKLIDVAFGNSNDHRSLFYCLYGDREALHMTAPLKISGFSPIIPGYLPCRHFSQLSLAFSDRFPSFQERPSLHLVFSFLLRCALKIFCWSYDLEKYSCHFLSPIGNFGQAGAKACFYFNCQCVQATKNIDEIPLHVLLTILLTRLFWYICYRINNKRDLK